MKTYEDCFSCFERQALDACAISDLSKDKTKEILHAVRQMTESFPCDRSPVVMAVEIHDLIRSVSGEKYPYSEIKKEVNQVCRECLHMLLANTAWSLNPLKTAVQLAIAGNVIDFGAYSAAHMTKRDIFHLSQEALSQPVSGDLEKFNRIVHDAERILYIADNAGECFFDSILLDFISPGKVTYAVRGGPILNDATMEDAYAAGIQKKCSVIDTGDNAPGVLLDRCSSEFRNLFDQSDVIIAKGQGNYESLSDGSGKVCIFLLKVKCDVIARDIGHAVGTNVLKIHKSVLNPAKECLVERNLVGQQA